MKDKYVQKIAVLTSGGDAPGMNAAIRAVVRASIYHKISVYGILHGYEGLIQDKFKELKSTDVSGILQLGGTILKSARSSVFKTKDGRKKAYENLTKRGIDALIVIGGDGTFNGALHLSREHKFPVIGLPGTIDNDIFGTDYTIGYDTALNTVISSIDKIKDTANSHDRLFLVEVMGNEAGALALGGGIATGAEIIITPQIKDPYEKIRNYLKDKFERKGSSGIVMVAEGTFKMGVYGLATKIDEEFPQYDTRVSVLGHMQRGGSPTATDRIYASQLGAGAIQALLDYQQNIMIGLHHGEITYVPLAKTIKMNQGVNENLLPLEDILNS